MIFSSRAFSTKPANLTTPAGVAANTSAIRGAAVQGHDNRHVEAPLRQPRQRCEEPGNIATAEQQHVLAKGSSRIVQHDDVPAQIDRIDASSSPEEDSTVHATMSSPTHTFTPVVKDRNCVASTSTYDMRLLSSAAGVMDDAYDTDYIPSSSDESASRFEEGSSDAEGVDEESSETHTPLEFQIPEDVLRAAMTAPENTKASFWSSNLYRGPEDAQILVHYCKTKEVAERVAKHFVNEKVVGFDIEWKPYAHPDSIKKNVSLIQLACEDRIALFHIALFQGITAAQLMPPTLKAILESPDVYKVGVAVKGDFSRMVKFLNVEPQGVFELSRLNNLVQHFATDPSKVTNKLVGLATQVQQHLQLPLYKGGHLIDDPEDLSNVRSSDWSLPLNRQQIHYAAADAYAGFRLFDVLEEKRKQLKPTPPRPFVCDYDSKPKPRSNVSKPRKKRTPVVKDEETAYAVVEESFAAAERTEEPDEEVEEKPQQSQDTEGYETAQEDLLDSHQLEGEEPGSSEESYESTDESDDDVSSDPGPSLKNKEIASATAASQRRAGRINLSQLRGSDPGYPTLPKLRSGEEPDVSSDEDLIDMSDRQDERKLDYKDNVAEISEEDEETDEFDDSELEEALQDLNIDSDGKMQETADKGAAIELGKSNEQTVPMSEDAAEPEKMQPSEAEDVKAETAPAADEPAIDREEQRLIDLLNDRHVVQYLHTPPPTAGLPPAPVSPPQAPPFESPATQSSEQDTQDSHTPEYKLATTWARTYLSTTIPSPTSLTPSHIRATVPHLRAYHMWHHQALSLGTIARQLRDPPLAESTVGSYVLQAITLERMDYDASAVKEVLMGMPSALRRGKWRGLAEKVDAR